MIGDIVSFETAKLLKEKGFKGKSLCAYDNYSNVLYDYGRGEREYNNYPFTFSAPLLHDAQKWLRVFHDTHISIDWGVDGYSFAITIKDEDGLFVETSYKSCYKSYEECLDDGIKESLKNIYYGEK